MFAHVPFGSGGAAGLKATMSTHHSVSTERYVPLPRGREGQLYKYESSKVHLSKTDLMERGEKKAHTNKHPI